MARRGLACSLIVQVLFDRLDTITKYRPADCRHEIRGGQVACPYWPRPSMTIVRSIAAPAAS
jgi:hypothetical protein